MIIYQATKAQFLEHVLSGEIEQIILRNFREKLRYGPSPKEVQAWRNSLLYMDKVLSDEQIPGNSGIAIECRIPQSAKRIDFVISGSDESGKPGIVIIELKQWTSAELTDKDGIVRTILNGGVRETNHPSYQAWSYAMLLGDYSEIVYSEKIPLNPCAFLHNYEEDQVIKNIFYAKYLQKAPVFLKKDMALLRDFIRQHVRNGDEGELIYRIDQGRIKPSKQLSESVAGLLKGKQEFILIDEQKLVYETALQLMESASTGKKQVLIVEGGPGTGKSVVAINLLVEMIRRRKNAQYVSKNAAPRAVYQARLENAMTKGRFSSLFRGSGSYINTHPDVFDALVVDESHRLNEKSGLYSNEGENQIKEIITAARSAIFFIDENQKVSIKDIGTKEEIRKWADTANADVTELELASQFRCNGSDGYLAWLDHVLQIRPTANTSMAGIPYHFRVMDSPGELRNLILEKNREANKARLVAGYCWNWVSKNDIRKTDINFPEYDFAMPWNFSNSSYLWSIKSDSVKEIGCIHTSQGLELDYVGVIIGPDLIVRNGKVLVDPSKRARTDASLKGYKSMMVKDEEGTRKLVRDIIKNTYRTLMTRGMKGCYVWCTDEETKEFFSKMTGND